MQADPAATFTGSSRCEPIKVDRNSLYASDQVRIVDRKELLSTMKVDMKMCEQIGNMTGSPPAMMESDVALYRQTLGEAVKRNKCMTYVEWGSGGSTFIAQEYSDRVVSVENHPEWCNIMLQHTIIQCSIAEGRMVYVCVNGGPVGHWGVPKNETSYQSHLYIEVLNNFADLHPDLVLVDGRYRVACALNSIKWSKPDSVLMIHDYHNRKHYWDVEKCFDLIDVGSSFDKHVFGTFTKKPNIDSVQYERQLNSFRNVFS